MVLASEFKPGIALKIEDRLYRVLEAVHHYSTGQMAGFVLLKLQDIRTRHLTERRVKPTDKLDDVTLAKRQMEYIYRDEESFYFMDPDTYKQYGIPKAAIDNIEKFLKEGMKVTVEMIGEEALALQFPKVVELKVTPTVAGIRGEQESTMKPATLENGMEILVPQFVETGEVVRVDTDKGKDVERVTIKKV
ncbi:MAG: elongation factor P [Bacteroidota bacterium]|jgi:elongation factor P